MTDTDTPVDGATSVDAPAGVATGAPDPAGRPSDDELAALPAKVRVHALARVVGLSSRELLAVLARLGVGARSAQSSLDRDAVASVVDDLYPGAPVPAAEVVPPADEPASSAVDDVAPAVPAAGDSGDTSAGSAPPGPPAFAAPPTFLAPSAESSAPSRPRRRRASRSAGAVTPDETTAAESTDTATDAATPVPADVETDASTDTGADADSGSDDTDADDENGRRRRRRGRRGRGRGRGSADDSGDENGDDSAESGSSDDGSGGGSDDGDASDDATDSDDDGDDEQSGAGSRRRRRRRRRSADSSDGNGDGDGGDGDDPPNTVTHVRERTDRVERPEKGSDEVKGVKGSTRLEAKRQRRRDGRDAGRRRPAILSESEFLARREAVERTMVVRQQADRSQIGVLEDGVLVEHFVAGEGQHSMVGNVYLGRVQNVLPSMEAAFVDIGRGRNAVLYAGEVNWDAAGLEGKQRKIEQALSSGDQVLVQVTKDPVGHKGARLTTQISLPGRFLVFVPGGGATGISRKLPENERKRLKEILKRIVPDESGVIIRTAAEGVSEEDLERDVRRLRSQWEVIERKAGEAKNAKGTSPTLLSEEPDLLIRVVRDMFNEDFASLVISGDRAWETLEGYISHVAPELAPRLSRHVGGQDVFTEYRIDEQILKALDRKVWLPSGGTLVIDRTEAMTVVDVNTGKFTGSGGNLEETVTRNNLEAAEEIVRQLRLRDIGGMIVVDFIDMVLESNRDLVLRRLTECLGRDRTRHQVSEVTSLGLVQMTRKRVGQGLLDEFSTTCEHCRGRGVIVSTEPTGAGDHSHRSGNGQGDGHGSANGVTPGSNGGGHGSGNGSGNGNGSSGGRRRGRGRRSAQAEAGPPPSEAGESESSESVATLAPTADMRRSSAAAVAAMASSAGVGTSPSGEAESGVAESGVAESGVAESGVAESGVAESGVAESGEPAEDAADLATPTAAEVALDTDLAEAPHESGSADTEADAPATVDAPEAPATETPEAAETPEATTTARPRRRRAASRPAGPPAGSGAAGGS